MAMPTVFSDLLFAFRRRTRRAPGRRRPRSSRAGAVAALGAALVLVCPGVALAAPGDLDPTFGTDGKVTTDFGGNSDLAFAVAVQADGRIVTAGESGLGGIGDFALARYNTDGSLDTTFGTDGRVTTDFAGNDGAFAVAVQADGRIVAAGESFSGVTFPDFALARYNTDGSLDTTFGTDGKVTTDFTGNIDDAFAVAVQADGRIIAAGRSVSGFSNNFALARYNTDGSLDTTFDTDGKVTTSFGGNSDLAFAVAVQADGRIVAAGESFSGVSNDFALARYNTDGSLDTTFDTDGKVTTSFGGNSDLASAVAVQADGKIIAAGLNSSVGTDDFALARYNTDGSLDTTFDTDGKVTTDFAGNLDWARAVAVQADGKIVAAGQSFSGDSLDFALARYQSSDGAPAGVDVSVTKTGPTTAELGDHISYTVTVTNTSTTDSATGLTLSDTLTGPGHLWSATASQGTCTRTSTSASCTLNTLAPGAGATVTVVVEPTSTGTVSDAATAQATEADPVADNNTATAITTVNPKGCRPGEYEACKKAG
ncbi:calcium-binding protein [Streptomyces sp. NPDC002133]|uniref:calcium-binding protein n=1 Tax=Streptomyces sp. NPDC002133 TaxID=3154409 RepID=UPI00332D44F7